MTTPFMQDLLLATSPNEGGISMIANGNATILDNYDTTGLWVTEDTLLRNVICGTPESKTMQLQAFSAEGKRVMMVDEHYDFHDILSHENHIYLVSTSSNEVIALDMDGHETKRYAFPGGNDSWHINCLGLWDGRIVLSAFGEFDTYRGYKHNSRLRGFVIDLETRCKLWEGLSQPHTPIQRDNRYFICNSEEKQVLVRDASSAVQCLQFDGYTRGIAFSDHFMYVGLSHSRNIIRDSPDHACARIVAIDITTMQTCGEISLPFAEIYDIRIVKNSSLLPIVMLSLNGAELKQELELQSWRAENLFTQFQRVNRHIITGSMLRFLRWAKHDKTFGSPDAIDQT